MSKTTLNTQPQNKPHQKKRGLTLPSPPSCDDVVVELIPRTPLTPRLFSRNTGIKLQLTNSPESLFPQSRPSFFSTVFRGPIHCPRLLWLLYCTVLYSTPSSSREIQDCVGGLACDTPPVAAAFLGATDPVGVVVALARSHVKAWHRWTERAGGAAARA